MQCAMHLFKLTCKLALNKGSARVDLVDVDGHTALHWAALGGNAEVCQILMENGISPNVQVHNSHWFQIKFDIIHYTFITHGLASLSGYIESLVSCTNDTVLNIFGMSPTGSGRAHSTAMCCLWRLHHLHGCSYGEQCWSKHTGQGGTVNLLSLCDCLNVNKV